MSGLFGSGQGTPIATQAVRANGIQVQQSSYGKALQIVYGRARVPGTLIWYGDFRATEHQQQTGKGGGGGTSTSYTYSSSFALALAEGPIQKIGTIWKGSGTTTIGDLNGSILTGSAGQNPWSHWSGAEALNYPYIAYVGALNIRLGSSPNIPNLNWEVYGLLPYQAGVIDDAEPSAILQDMLTNPQHGMGFGALGDLTQYRNYCVATGRFISPVIAEERSALEIIKELLAITNSTALWSGGKLTIIPYCDRPVTGHNVTYTPDSAIRAQLGPDDFATPVTIVRKPLADVHNTVKLEFVDRSNQYVTSVVQVQEQADIERRGVRSKKTIQAHPIMDGALATLVASTILRRGMYIRNTYRFGLLLTHVALEPGDIVTLTDPLLGLLDEPVRITSIREGSDLELSVQAEEFPAGVAEGSTYTIEPVSGFVPNVHGTPDATATPVLFRGPQFLTDGPEVWMGAAGSGPNWGGANIWVSYDNTHYTQVGSVGPGCRYGTLSATLSQSATAVDQTNSFGVELLGPGQLTGGTQQDADELVTLLLIDQELIGYTATTLNTDGTYTLGTYLQRGAYNTHNAAHSIGAPWLRIDDHFFRWRFDPGNTGDTLYIKFQAFNLYGGGAQDLATLNAVAYVLGAAEEIPDTPAAPTNLIAQGTVNGIKLGWLNPNPAAVGMSSLEFSSDGVTWTVLGQTQSDEYTHHFLGSTTWHYRVQSRSPDFLWSPYSSTVTATGGGLDYAQDSPTRFAAIQAGADKTSYNTAAAIAGQGALATKGSVDLATGDVLNKTLGNIADTATYGRVLQTHLAGNRPWKLWRPVGLIDISADDLSKHSEVTQHIGGLGIPTVGAGVVNETTARKWAGESGATVGAVAGTNLYSSTGTSLADGAVITAQGTAADTAKVAGYPSAFIGPLGQQENVGYNRPVTVSAGTVGGRGPFAPVSDNTGVTNKYTVPTSSLPVSITVDLKHQLPQLSGIVIQSYYPADNRFLPSAGTVDGSTDNATWTLGIGSWSGKTSSFYVSISGSYRYLRINCTGAPINNNGQTSTSLSGCRVYAYQGVSVRNLDADVEDGTNRFAAVTPFADQTSNATAASIAGQGALATKGSVDLATGEVLNKTAANITYSTGGTVDSFKPAVPGATLNRVPATYGTENLFIDPMATDNHLWSNQSWSINGTGGITSPALAASGQEILISSYNPGASTKYKCDAGQSFTVGVTVDSVTGTATGGAYLQIFNSLGAFIAAYGIFDKGAGTYTHVGKFSTGAAYFSVALIARGAASGGTVTLSNFFCRIGSQTLIDPGGVQVGDNRQLHPVLAAGSKITWENLAITYTAAAGTPATATISVSAAQLLGLLDNAATVSYNATSANVSGTGGTTVTYYLYYVDKLYAGATQTLVTTTNANDTRGQLGCVYIGSVNVFFPTSGTGGGGGTTGLCVCDSMFVREGMLAGKAEIGNWLNCLDYPSGGHWFTRRIRNLQRDTVPCVRIITRNGAVLDCSTTTPFDLIGGGTAFAPDMLGESVVTDWGIERVVSVEDIGLQPVSHIDLGGCSYAAGEDGMHRVYSHNATIK